jgi:hypothetical protein
VKELLKAATEVRAWRFFARLAIMHALHGKPESPMSNPDDAPPSPQWRGQRKRDPWR